MRYVQFVNFFRICDLDDVTLGDIPALPNERVYEINRDTPPGLSEVKIIANNDVGGGRLVRGEAYMP
jgi:hypothetical protein